MPNGYIYIIHFDDKLHHAQHYCGSTMHLQMRLTTHAFGHGSKICRALMERGIEWKLGSLFQCCKAEMRRVERSLKDQKNAHRFCGICGPGQRLAHTLPYSIANIPFPVDSDCIRRCGKLSFWVGGEVRVRLTTDSEPPSTLRFIKDTMQIDKDCLGFIPVSMADDSEGIRYMSSKGLICIVSNNSEDVGYTAFTCDLEARTVNIHQCVVIDQARLLGHGKAMIDFIREKFPRRILCAKVRDDLVSNEFWISLGFKRLHTKTHKTSGSKIHQYFLEPIFPPE